MYLSSYKLCALNESATLMQLYSVKDYIDNVKDKAASTEQCCERINDKITNKLHVHFVSHKKL